MPVLFTNGDVFENEGLRAYVFGATTRGGLDRGIGVAAKKRWPKMADALALHAEAGNFALGDVWEWKNDDETVFVVALQRPAPEKAKFTAFSRGLPKVLELAEAAKITNVGIARTAVLDLDWTRVKLVLSELAVPETVTLSVFEKFVRTKPA